ncbi:MAG: adenine deaminase [Bacteroidota bacterium]|nr:adenine deaminase [Bacteroidota bacterium]
MKKFSISGNIVDPVGERIFPGTLFIQDGVITEIREEMTGESRYILPGLIDAHIHIESSMLIPSEFARAAVIHGTVATVSDPHEIANVLGTEGVRFMIRNGKKVPFHFYFGAPSCVPATPFETAGGNLGVEETEELLQMDEIWYLSEMMNVPGVLFKDPAVMAKLDLARKYGKPVDGHAPGVTGKQASEYYAAGISTDHECFTLEEAVDKIRRGMHILIREGSAARNFETLCPLINEYPDQVMFCSDDKHPDDLLRGHMNELVKRSIRKGFNPLKVIRCCTLNPARHYHLDTGMLQKGDPADLILVDTLENFNVNATYIRGEKVAENGKSLIAGIDEEPVNQFNAHPVTEKDFYIEDHPGNIRVIQALDGQLITKEIQTKPRIVNDEMTNDTKRDILKIVVINRYKDALPAKGFITGFGLKHGAIASSVAHDSHNVIAIGADDKSLTNAVNLVIKNKGGIAVVNGNDSEILPLPVAGIMSTRDVFTVARMYENLDQKAKELGCPLKSPFMTMSFMALLVIPELKLSDKGLFDGRKFELTTLCTE